MRSTIPTPIIRAMIPALLLGAAPAWAQTTCPPTAVDVDGNVYPVVQIGDQCWMAENLRTAHYRNGWPIMTGLTDLDWDFATIGAYLDVEMWGEGYGKLYNWYAVADPRGICPEGWKIASNDDWDILLDHLGGPDVASHDLRSMDGWMPPNAGATNASGFSAKGAGMRNAFNGQTQGTSTGAFFWTSSGTSVATAWVRYLTSTTPAVYSSEYASFSDIRNALSCRCIQDHATGLEEVRMMPAPTVWPNPFSDQVSIHWEHDLPALAQVFDPSGRVLRELLLTTALTSVPLDDLLPGMYVLRVQGRHVQGTARIVRE